MQPLTAKPKRKRGVPVQVYLSAAECADIQKLARKRGVSVSTLVRSWVRRATAATRGPKAVAAQLDPRQLQLADAHTECPLAHIGIHDAGCDVYAQKANTGRTKTHPPVTTRAAPPCPQCGSSNTDRTNGTRFNTACDDCGLAWRRRRQTN
jgi:predicted RNA-binding Zn-ribbon protein involved in translation (DUF1610 family)